MSARQLAEELLPDTSVDTILRWAREGTIPSRKRGQKVFFLRYEIDEWLIGDGTRDGPATP
ncbi:MAG: helix-turn-helix domain-containing protein [Patulibacter sp.]|nr:helix-turn-helix domain-containing protein [Patulibacter sp.]